MGGSAGKYSFQPQHYHLPLTCKKLTLNTTNTCQHTKLSTVEYPVRKHSWDWHICHHLRQITV